MKDDTLYLIHIEECSGRIEQYVAAGREAFIHSTLIQDAVPRNLQTLAESTQSLSEAVKTTHPEPDWRAIAGFRNVLAHNYPGMDVSHIWQVVEKDLPELKRQIATILKSRV